MRYLSSISLALIVHVLLSIVGLKQQRISARSFRTNRSIPRVEQRRGSRRRYPGSTTTIAIADTTTTSRANAVL